MLKVGIVGISGRMGHAIYETCVGLEGVKVVLGIDRNTEGAPVGFNAPLVSNVKEITQDPDIFIDFTRPACSLEILEYAKEHNIRVILGTTGFTDEQKRLIAATFKTTGADLRIVCGYFPNGSEVGSEKFAYKLAWLNALNLWLKDELTKYHQLALLGDFNIAPDDRDVWDPKGWEGNILVSPQERQAFKNLLSLGLSDSFRLFEQSEKRYTWWDYRMLGFQKNHGLRIDHILVSEALKSRLIGVDIDKEPRKWTKPSDHTPYWIALR